MLTLTKCQEIVNLALVDLKLPGEPANLYDPIRYILDIGGKRLRPCFAIMACNVYDDNVGNSVNPAIAYEVFHNFTLMHDDIMDNSSLRRNKPTVHVKWNTNTGILSGDAMVIKAYEILSASPENLLPNMLDIFNSTALKVCEGQQLDLDYEQKIEIKEEDYLQMIKLKTSALLAGALETGAYTGGADARDRAKFHELGINTGIAFQIQDDWLDVYAGDSSFGKVKGNDIINNKKTMLLVKALELAGGTYKKELLKWIETREFDPEEKLMKVKSIFEALKIREITLKIIEDYYKKALKNIDEINASPERKTEIYNITQKLLERKN